jgi:hypothetical protein
MKNPQQSPIDQSAVGRLISRFIETGSFADLFISGRPKIVTNAETTTAVLP